MGRRRFGCGMLINTASIGENGYAMTHLHGGGTPKDTAQIWVETTDWIESTEKKADETLYPGYTTYMSDSNKGVGSSAAWMRVHVKGVEVFEFVYGSFAEGNYDYVVIGSPNVSLQGRSVSQLAYNSSGIDMHSRGQQSKDAPNIGASYDDLDKTQEYFFDVVYRKDGSVNRDDDRGYFAVMLKGEHDTF